MQILKKNQSYTNAKTPLRKRSLQTNPKKTLKFKSFNDLKLAKIRSLSKKLPNQFLYKSQTHWSSTLKKQKYVEEVAIVEKLGQWEDLILKKYLKKQNQTYFEKFVK